MNPKDYRPGMALPTCNTKIVYTSTNFPIENTPNIIEKEKGKRYNSGKPRWSLIDFDSLLPMVRAAELGEKKYGRDNWKKGLPPKDILESAFRHLTALMAGETVDEEGIPHIGALQWNAMAYQYMITKDQK